MKVKSSGKAGQNNLNHTQTVRGLRVKSKVKAGINISDCGPWFPNP